MKTMSIGGQAVENLLSKKTVFKLLNEEDLLKHGSSRNCVPCIFHSSRLEARR